MTQATALTLRAAATDGADDAALRALLESVYVGEGFTPASEAGARLDPAPLRGAATVWVALVRDELVGTLALAPGGTALARLAAPGEGELRLLAVRPELRGAGVGAALVREAQERARALGHTRLVLWTQTSMLAAQRLYARLGFARRPERDWALPDGRSYLVFDWTP